MVEMGASDKTEAGDEMGLRERSRARRRAAIQRSGMRLFAEQGYDSTTIADIAHAAEVSPRTVSLYFPTKFDIATSYLDEAFSRLAERMEQEGPDHRSAVDVIAQWLRDERSDYADLFALQSEMGHANAQLRSPETPTTAAATERLVVCLATDLGRERDDATVEIVGSAIGGVMTYLSELDMSQPDAGEKFSRALEILRTMLDSCRA